MANVIDTEVPACNLSNIVDEGLRELVLSYRQFRNSREQLKPVIQLLRYFDWLKSTIENRETILTNEKHLNRIRGKTRQEIRLRGLEVAGERKWIEKYSDELREFRLFVRDNCKEEETYKQLQISLASTQQQIHCFFKTLKEKLKDQKKRTEVYSHIALHNNQEKIENLVEGLLEQLFKRKRKIEDHIALIGDELHWPSRERTAEQEYVCSIARQWREEP